jgi:hypothetical protein
MTTARPSRVGALMLARRDQPARIGRYLPPIGVVLAGIVIVLIAVAAVLLRDAHSDRARADYADGAKDVSVEALTSRPAAYIGARVHVRGRAGSEMVGDGETQMIVGSLAEMESPSSNPGVLVIGPEDVAVLADHEVDVWGVVEPSRPVPVSGSGHSVELVVVRARYVVPVSR